MVNEGLEIYMLLFIIGFIAFILILFLYLSTKKTANKLRQELNENKERFSSYQTEMEPLRKYRSIVDVEAEVKRIKLQAISIRDRVQAEVKRIRSKIESIRKRAQSDYDKKLSEANELANSELKESRQKAKEIRERAEKQLQDAHEIAKKIETDAQEKATQIAGDAWEAKENVEQYESTVKAMKNIIKGYGDEYLIPNRSVLDELATEYDHKEAGRELSKIRVLIRSMIKNDEAAECDYVESHRKARAIEFVLDAFNGKVDTIMAKVKHDNYGKLKQQLEDALRLVNHNGKAFRNARIIPRYFDVMRDQLKMAVAVQELKRIDQEEQRRIKELMREEERARREYEKAIREAEKEEKMLQKAMAVAEKKLATAAAEERSLFEEELAKLKEQLDEAEARGQRAISMAQQTKRGHVYVISNIGSFGEEVFKIGLTRRLEPMDRVKELGDASVPFPFDVHAIIHSEDAPSLEYDLHQFLELNQVNKVNPRKEFFRASLSEIKKKVDDLGVETHWTLKAEAIQYRESLEIERSLKSNKLNDSVEVFEAV